MNIIHSTLQDDSYCELEAHVPMPRWGWMTATHILLDPQHICSSIAKIHADALSNYWVSRQTEQ